ncbi:hypothetical protein ABS767_11790 [Sphingomonas sp. ST-64]|uniref:Uncharacterized protein n=1 Tax=Sphingomonas plantiphila TaxID=3163295 RepID=A0ABW8YP06_9SPHN
MGNMLALLIILGGIAFPFIAMPLLWRRMKRVRDASYDAARAREPVRTPWEENEARGDGLATTRRDDPNEALIALGDRARHSRWPLDNQ